MGCSQTIAALAVERRRCRHPAAPRCALWFAVNRDIENLAVAAPLDLELRVSAYSYLFPELARHLFSVTEISSAGSPIFPVPHA